MNVTEAIGKLKQFPGSTAVTELKLDFAATDGAAIHPHDRMKKALAEIKDIAEDVSISVGAALKKIHDLADTALALR